MIEHFLQTNLNNANWDSCYKCRNHYDAGCVCGFETRNDDYKIWLGAGVKGSPVKAWFDESIRKAQDVEVRSTTIQAALSPAVELKKYKELSDMDVITHEELDAKKKQFLGL